MNTWIRGHLDAFGDALRQLGAQPAGTLLGITVIASAELLAMAGFLAITNLGRLGDRIGTEGRITLYLAATAGDSERRGISQALAHDPAVRRSEFVGRDRALADLSRRLGRQDLLVGLDSNPLPDAFVVTPATAAIADSGLLEQRLSQLPGIESIESDPEWSRRWSALLERAMVVVLGAGVLAGLAMVAICYSTVRLQVLTYSERSVVMRLFGATSGQIRRPFMYFGAIQGLVSGIVAVALLDLVLIAFEPMLGTLIQQYGGLTGLSGLSWADQASVVLISIVGGAGGAWLASRGY